MKIVSQFREFDDPWHGERSLRDCIETEAQFDEQRIVDYLRDGVCVLLATDLPPIDAVDGTHLAGERGHILSDGAWAWRDDLAHYVARYHVRIPEAFCVHMQANCWRVPQLSEDDALATELKVLTALGLKPDGK